MNSVTMLKPFITSMTLRILPRIPPRILPSIIKTKAIESLYGRLENNKLEYKDILERKKIMAQRKSDLMEIRKLPEMRSSHEQQLKIKKLMDEVRQNEEQMNERILVIYREQNEIHEAIENMEY